MLNSKFYMIQDQKNLKAIEIKRGIIIKVEKRTRKHKKNINGYHKGVKK